MSRHTEHDKVDAKMGTIIAISEFLEWAERQGMFLARDVSGYGVDAICGNNTDVVYAYLGIDKALLRKEQDSMLSEMKRLMSPK